VPFGLYNEIQDIDPSYLWSLLPQSVYPITSRNGTLTLYGGAVYGAVSMEGMGLPKKLGKLEYRGWSGLVSLPTDDGYFVPLVEAGLVPGSAISYVESGATLRWVTPVPGLMIGASAQHQGVSNAPFSAGNGAISGPIRSQASIRPDYFAKYEKNKLMVSAEFSRQAFQVNIDFNGLPPVADPVNDHEGYVMASYKITDKLTAGVYDSQLYNKALPLGPARYSKDWALSGRYDFNQFLYAKAEEHFLDGTALSYDANLNPGGLKPNTKLTILKVGVSF
jgi:hypothetical protein